MQHECWLVGAQGQGGYRVCLLESTEAVAFCLGYSRTRGPQLSVCSAFTRRSQAPVKAQGAMKNESEPTQVLVLSRRLAVEMYSKM